MNALIHKLIGIAVALTCVSEVSAAEPATRPATQPSTRPQRPAAKAADAEAFFSDGVIPRLRIDITPEEFDKLRKTPRAYVRGTIRESLPGKPDVVYQDVGVHLKGSAGSFRGVDDRPAMTLNFSRFDKSRPYFHGLDKIHLNNSVQDPSYLCENIGGHVFRAAGVPAPRITNARVWLNGRDLGFFVLKDSFDSIFLRYYFFKSSGTIFEGTLIEIDQALPAKTNEAAKNLAKLKELAAAANERDPAVRRQKIDKLLDVERFHAFLACEAMIVHWDGYSGNRNNYRIYDNPTTGKFVFLPHGMDQIIQRAENPLVQGAGLLGRAVTEFPEDRSRYLERVAELRKSAFNPDVLSRRIDEITARTLPVLREISPEVARDHAQRAADLKQRIVARAANIDQQLAALPRMPKFDISGAADVATWNPVTAGPFKLDRIEESGKPILRIRSGNGGGAASYRTTVLLPRGRYTLETRCRTIGVVAAEGANTGAGLRMSGVQRQSRVVGDTDWQKIEFAFEISEPSREVVLVAELNATRGEAFFDLQSFKIRRQK